MRLDGPTDPNNPPPCPRCGATHAPGPCPGNPPGDGGDGDQTGGP